jgi:hypothetical protein
VSVRGCKAMYWPCPPGGEGWPLRVCDGHPAGPNFASPSELRSRLHQPSTLVRWGSHADGLQVFLVSLDTTASPPTFHSLRPPVPPRRVARHQPRQGPLCGGQNWQQIVVCARIPVLPKYCDNSWLPRVQN